jgi:hypothetical protein
MDMHEKHTGEAINEKIGESIADMGISADPENRITRIDISFLINLNNYEYPARMLSYLLYIFVLFSFNSATTWIESVSPHSVTHSEYRYYFDFLLVGLVCSGVINNSKLRAFINVPIGLTNLFFIIPRLDPFRPALQLRDSLDAIRYSMWDHSFTFLKFAAVLYLITSIVDSTCQYLYRAKQKALPVLNDFYWPPATKSKSLPARWLRVRPLIFLCLSIVLWMLLLIHVISGARLAEAFLPRPLASSGYLLILIMSLATFCLFCAFRFANLSADEVLKIDTRKPILILRSFADERKLDGVHDNLLHPTDRFTLEPMLTGQLAKFGPSIALHKPGKRLPFLNTATESVSSADWQEKFLSYVDKAGIIVFIVGKSRGLIWELEQVVTRGLLYRTILIIPPHVGGQGVAWNTFLNKLPRRMGLYGLKDLQIEDPVLVRWTSKGKMLLLQSSTHKTDNSCALALQYCIKMTATERAKN